VVELLRSIEAPEGGFRVSVGETVTIAQRDRRTGMLRISALGLAGLAAAAVVGLGLGPMPDILGDRGDAAVSVAPQADTVGFGETRQPVCYPKADPSLSSKIVAVGEKQITDLADAVEACAYFWRKGLMTPGRIEPSWSNAHAFPPDRPNQPVPELFACSPKDGSDDAAAIPTALIFPVLPGGPGACEAIGLRPLGR
jgi:hypothetical protein